MALFCPLLPLPCLLPCLPPSLPHWPLSIAVKNIMEVMISDGDGAEEEKACNDAKVTSAIALP